MWYTLYMNCSLCDQPTAVDGFAAGRRHCKKCASKRVLVIYRKNVKQWNQTVQKRRHETRDWVNQLKLDAGCSLCGFHDHSKPLHFHHRNTAEKWENVSTLVTRGYGRTKIQTEMDKCDVLCQNCHLSVHGGVGGLDKKCQV